MGKYELVVPLVTEIWAVDFRQPTMLNSCPPMPTPTILIVQWLFPSPQPALPLALYPYDALKPVYFTHVPRNPSPSPCDSPNRSPLLAAAALHALSTPALVAPRYVRGRPNLYVSRESRRQVSRLQDTLCPS